MRRAMLGLLAQRQEGCHTAAVISQSPAEVVSVISRACCPSISLGWAGMPSDAQSGEGTVQGVVLSLAGLPREFL